MSEDWRYNNGTGQLGVLKKQEQQLVAEVDADAAELLKCFGYREEHPGRAMSLTDEEIDGGEVKLTDEEIATRAKLYADRGDYTDDCQEWQEAFLAFAAGARWAIERVEPKTYASGYAWRVEGKPTRSPIERERDELEAQVRLLKAEVEALRARCVELFNGLAGV